VTTQAPLTTLSASETWLEVWPFEPVSRAVRFINFLHESASASDVELEPVEGARYRFRVSSSPSTVVEALLSTTELFPESIHSSLSGPLEVRLSAANASEQATRSSFTQGSSRPTPSYVTPESKESEPQGGSSLVQAFEHLDQALGEGSVS
jgi:hypothetical protein